MTYTEQSVFRDAADGDIRERGTGVGFDRLRQAMLEMPGSPGSDDMREITRQRVPGN
jgi:hypothetical protein